MLVHHFLENAAARLSDKVAVICGDQRLTYKEINDSADRLAVGLISMDVKRQDRVVIFLESSAESVIALFGVLKAGAAFVMLNPAIKPRKLNYILRDCGAKALVTNSSMLQTVNEAVSAAEELKCIIWTGDVSEHLEKDHNIRNFSYEDLRSLPLTSKLRSQDSAIDIDLATIIYTSGSTGEPKGVMSAHCNVVSAVRSITQYLENEENDIILNALPLSFDYGLYQVLMGFYFGGTVVLELSFAYPYKILARIAEERITGFPIVPTMAAMLLQMHDLPSFDFTSLRYVTNTAAALPIKHIRKLQALFPHVKIFSMYGLTECKRVSYLPPDQLASRPGSVGIPMPNEEVFIVDEKGREVEHGEVGELVVRGSNVMQGYWNDPEATARRFRPGRYRGEALLYTGDLFRKDEEGFLYFVARKDDIIKTKGERVSPKEIENILYELEGVVDAAVVGVPDEICGQAIKAFISTNGDGLTREAVMRYCQRNLEPFMVPKYVVFQKSLPKSPSGKIEKNKLI